MLQDPSCNVVECGDPNCKLCTAGRPGEGGPMEQAYCVYTCESPNCSLCRVETDVLLDLFCPFNSDQDIKEMMRKIINLTEADAPTQEPTATMPACYNEPLQANNMVEMSAKHESSQLLRELLQNTPGRDMAHEIDTAQSLKLIDESCLMDLALELQVDKLDDLPELKGQGIIEFI